MPPKTNFRDFTRFKSDRITDAVVADAGTPQEIANQPRGGTFRAEVPDNIPSTALEGNTSIDDVFQARDQAEQAQGLTNDLSGFNPETTSEVTAFNDPDATILSILYGDSPLSQAEQQQQDILGDVSRTTSNIDRNLTSTRERAEDTTQLSERERALASTNEDIARRQTQFRREMRAFEGSAEQRGVDRASFLDEKGKIEADAKAELADLYIIQNAQNGNVEAARSYINTAVNNRYRSIEIELKQKQAELDALIPTLNKEAKEEAQQLQIALSERERNLGNEKEEAKNKRNLMLEVAGLGGSDSLQKQILNAPTEDQAAMLTASFVGRQMRAQKAAAAAGSGGVKAPTIKEINGVDYQWNEQIGIWEEVVIAGGGNGTDDTDTALSNINFLLDASDRIVGADVSSVDGSEKNYDKLYKGSAQSIVTRGIGNLLTGTNKQKRLEAQVDTLRANMLTLATDPNIKKFFGPQMSDADVRLMTAAGTSLRPGSQSDQELKAETERIQDWLNRAKTAIIDGTTSSPQNIITAPDGTRVQIVD